jgi:hypothetical protein
MSKFELGQTYVFVNLRICDASEANVTIPGNVNFNKLEVMKAVCSERNDIPYEDRRGFAPGYTFINESKFDRFPVWHCQFPVAKIDSKDNSRPTYNAIVKPSLLDSTGHSLGELLAFKRDPYHVSYVEVLTFLDLLLEQMRKCLNDEDITISEYSNWHTYFWDCARMLKTYDVHVDYIKSDNKYKAVLLTPVKKLITMKQALQVAVDSFHNYDFVPCPQNRTESLHKVRQVATSYTKSLSNYRCSPEEIQKGLLVMNVKEDSDEATIQASSDLVQRIFHAMVRQHSEKLNEITQDEYKLEGIKQAISVDPVQRK